MSFNHTDNPLAVIISDGIVAPSRLPLAIVFRFRILQLLAGQPAEADIEHKDCELIDMEVEESTNPMV